MEDFDIPASGPESIKHSYPYENKNDSHSERLLLLLKNLNLEGLNDEEIGELMKIFNDFPDQFYLPGDKLGKTNILKHKIITSDEKPIYVKQYRYPPVHRDEIARQIDELMESNIIQFSTSPYNSPL